MEQLHCLPMRFVLFFLFRLFCFFANMAYGVNEKTEQSGIISLISRIVSNECDVNCIIVHSFILQPLEHVCFVEFVRNRSAQSHMD